MRSRRACWALESVPGDLAGFEKPGKGATEQAQPARANDLAAREGQGEVQVAATCLGHVARSRRVEFARFGFRYFNRSSPFSGEVIAVVGETVAAGMHPP